MQKHFTKRQSRRQGAEDMSDNDYRAEERAARDEAEKAIAEACKAIEAAASGDAAAIAEHYSAAEEHADNARHHARKAHTYAADEAARNAANAVIEAEMAIYEEAHDIAEAIADEANATNAQRAHAISAAFAELITQPWTATAEDRAAVDAMVQAIAEKARKEAEQAARIAAAEVIDAYAKAVSISPADVTEKQHRAAYAVAAAELIPQPHRPTGYAKATASDYAELARMVAAIAR
ncbi:MAG: hypothetical protein IKF78_13605 [Atopobiaceae bacterium]|nr:hypothetical protein [Atopobiaceae bacterium]